MLTFRRPLALAATAVTAAGVFVLSSVPASAITPPAWPTTGRMPTGCATLTPSSAPTTWLYNFTDTASPTLDAISVGGGISSSGSTVVVGTAVKPIHFDFKVSEPCSGVQAVLIFGSSGGGALSGALPLANTTTDVFAGTWRFSGAVSATEVGFYTFPFIETARRYDAFTLDKNGVLVASTDTTSSPVFVANPLSLKRFYVLAQSTLTATATASVRKGRAATIRGVLTYASPTGIKPDTGEKIVVQTRVGKSGAWVTRATLTASSTGAISWSYKPAKTSQVRLVHAAVLSGRYTAASTSPVRTIKVV